VTNLADVFKVLVLKGLQIFPGKQLIPKAHLLRSQQLIRGDSNLSFVHLLKLFHLLDGLLFMRLQVFLHRFFQLQLFGTHKQVAIFAICQFHHEFLFLLFLPP
jgi:hypothetical protein